MIVVDETRDRQRHRIRYSNLRNVVVGTTQIRSVVDVEDLDAPTAAARQPKEVKFVTNLAPSHGVVQDVKKLLQNSAVEWDFHEGESAWQAYLPMLVFSGVILLVFIFLLRRLGGAGSPMQFGRSRGKLYAMEDLAITFDDVAGIDEAVAEGREIVDFLKSPEKYQRLGGRIPRGVLLVGPPGTGKTLLAKAIAGEAGVPFFGLSGSDFVEMFVGVGAARVRDMFQQAEQKAPCIIFIDELDALGKSRGNSIMGSHDEREQTLNALLVEMDGFDSNRGVIVMAATNRPEILDGALLRPGRFDRQVLVDRPDIMGRAAILKVHVKHVKLDESVDIDQIAAITPGFAGADLANLVNEAALLAARREKPAVTMEEFNESVERAMAGLEKKQRVMNDDEKLRVAYHEAGHALVAYSLPNTDPVHKVSIIPRGMAALGYTLQRPEGDRFLMTQAELESNIQVLMAGTIAEELVFQDVSTGAKNDLERATKIARSMVTEYGMSRLGRINLSGSTSSAFLPSLTEEATAYHSEQTAREV
ncbi:MAG TPA: ATP-dependent zinc metalloprotease FtsH, partial [Planctomycetaceae bacterium]|nr:ATP-dependent zinc metalloprotease FtsH [Planctomycetaceae bacterium]